MKIKRVSYKKIFKNGQIFLKTMNFLKMIKILKILMKCKIILNKLTKNILKINLDKIRPIYKIIKTSIFKIKIYNQNKFNKIFQFLKIIHYPLFNKI